MHGQKLEALGRLATGVAHDFNNLLTVIVGYSDLLRQQPPPATAQMCLEELRKSAWRAAELTSRLLAFGRKQPASPRPLDLNARVRDMEPMLRRLLGDDIQVATELAPALAPVHADPVQMEQVILNLAVNARDAMPQGGSLTIITENRPVADDAAGTYVVLSVRDTGCGIDAATQAHIFEPFFTTKEAGRGTGLGLATISAIVRGGGGRVDVASRPGEGATFRIYLPAVEAA